MPPPAESSATQELDTAAAGTRVKVDGTGLLLGSANRPAFSEVELRQSLAELQAAGYAGSLEFLVLSYPDLVGDLLLAGPDPALGGEAYRTVAAALDATSGPAVGRPWSQLAAALAGPAEGGLAFAQARAAYFQQMAEGNCEGALQTELVASARRLNAPAAEIEALRLDAAAHQLLNQPRQSVDLLQQAIARADRVLPLQATRLRLALGEAYRQTGQREAWIAAWTEAVTAESRAMIERQLLDPAFWTQAAFLRPADGAWPDPVVADFRQLLARRGIDFPETLADESQRESIVWAVIGVQSSQRHESHNALLAFKKSEALVADPRLSGQLLLHQAIAMLDAGQAGPAAPVLVRLASAKGPNADRARAVLGSLKLQHGSLEQGLNLIQSAVQTLEQWPLEEQWRTQSDLALAYLMQGREQRGIALQDEMAEAFARAGCHNHAVQCLSNQEKYYESTRQPEKLAATRARLDDLRRRRLAPAAPADAVSLR